MAGGAPVALIVNLDDPLVAADTDVEDARDEMHVQCAAGALEDVALAAALLFASGFTVVQPGARPRNAADLQAEIARHAPAGASGAAAVSFALTVSQQDRGQSGDYEPEDALYIVVVVGMCTTDDDDVSINFADCGSNVSPNAIAAMVAAAAGRAPSLFICDLATLSSSMFRGHAGDDDDDDDDAGAHTASSLSAISVAHSRAAPWHRRSASAASGAALLLPPPPPPAESCRSMPAMSDAAPAVG